MLVLRCYMQHCNRKVASRLRKPLVVSHCLNLTVSRRHEIVIPYIRGTKRLKSEKVPQKGRDAQWHSTNNSYFYQLRRLQVNSKSGDGACLSQAAAHNSSEHGDIDTTTGA